MDIDWKSKLCSRKFWAAVTSFVAMLMIALGRTESAANQTTALIMAGASLIAYIIGEGLADAAGAQQQTVFVEQEKPPEDEDDLK